MKFRLSGFLFTSIFFVPVILSAQENITKGIYRAEPNPAQQTVQTIHTKQSGKLLRTPAATIYSHGDPTAEEQYTLELINRARANPTAEGIRLAETKDQEVVNNCNGWGVNQQSMKGIFAAFPVRPPLAFNAKLIAAARRHSNDMYTNNFQSHTGSDGSRFDQRIEQAGYVNFSTAAENVGAQAGNLWAGHCGFNIDWGNADPGHRRAIMNYEGAIYAEAGIGIVVGTPKSNAGPITITHEFALKTDRFILGVVYKDNNNNNFYDVGEGLSGITITLSKGNFYAVTSTSGGYAIPVSGLSGPVTITAEGTGLGGKTSKSAILSGENIKVDFTSALPGMVSLTFPEDQGKVNNNSVQFRWAKTQGVTDYNFELAKDANFTQKIKSVTSTKDTFTTVADLKNGTSYFWRVRGKTSAGWGDFSPAYSFDVEIVPGVPTLVSPKNEAVFGTTSVTLVWKKANPSATKYLVEVATDPEFFEIVKADSNVTDTNYALAYLDMGKTYYWHVQAMNDPVWGAMSDYNSFSIKQMPAKVVLITEEKNYAPAEQITLSWHKVSDATNYRIAIRNSSGQIIYDYTISDTSHTVKPTPAEDSYTWTVQAGNANGFGEESNAGKFTVGTSSVEILPVDKISFVNYPNPAEKETVVKFNLPTEEKISVEIFDERGALIQRLFEGKISFGEHSFKWDVRVIQSGRYYCRLSGRNFVSTLPISVVK